MSTNKFKHHSLHLWPIIISALTLACFFASSAWMLTLLILATAAAIAIYAPLCWNHYFPNRRSVGEHIDRILSMGMWSQIIMLVVFCLLTIGIGWIIVDKCDISLWTEDNASPLQSVVYYFFDPGNLSNEVNGAISSQLTSLIISSIGMVLLGGLLISTISNIIERRVQHITEGSVTYKSLTNHYVIIGAGEITSSLIDKLLNEPGGHKILVLTEKDVPPLRAQIHSHGKRHQQKVIFYQGNIESKSQIERLNLNKAYEVFIVGEDEGYSRDTKNLNSAKMVGEVFEETKDRDSRRMLQLNVLFDRYPSFSTIQRLNFPNNYFGKSIYFHPFNFQENWARLMWGFTSRNEQTYSRLDFIPLDENKHVHLVIVGFNRTGLALMLEALRICHYPSYNPNNPASRTKITVVDKEFGDFSDYYHSQYPYIDSIEDIDIEYRTDDFCSPQMRQYISQLATDRSVALTIAICLQDADLSLAIGINMPECVYYQPKPGTTENLDKNLLPRVLIRQEVEVGLQSIVDKDEGHYLNVRVFGMLSECFNRDIFDDFLPRLLHADYSANGLIDRLYSAVKPEPDDSLTLEQRQKNFISTLEAEQQHWLTDWNRQKENMRWANRYAIDIYPLIKNMETPLDSDGNPIVDEKYCSMEHRRWMAERYVFGFRQAKPGEKRNNEFFVHNCLIPFDELSDSEKKKDKSILLMPKMVAIKEFFDSLPETEKNRLLHS